MINFILCPCILSYTCILLQDGVLVKGIYLQGAGWDMKNACLVEAEPMQLVCPIPTIHFKPVEGRRKSQRGALILCYRICVCLCMLE